MIRNTFGFIFVVIGAGLFQLGFMIMTKDVQERFAVKFIEGFNGVLYGKQR